MPAIASSLIAAGSRPTSCPSICCRNRKTAFQKALICSRQNTDLGNFRKPHSVSQEAVLWNRVVSEPTDEWLDLTRYLHGLILKERPTGVESRQVFLDLIPLPG